MAASALRRRNGPCHLLLSGHLSEKSNGGTAGCPLGCFALMAALLGLQEQDPPGQSLGTMVETLIVVWTYSFAYYGLRGREGWVIPLLLVASAFTLTRSLPAFFEPAGDLLSLLHKIIEAAFVSFSVYQIHVFRKPEVRQFLGAVGKVIV
jgi:hypothetical protein